MLHPSRDSADRSGGQLQLDATTIDAIANRVVELLGHDAVKPPLLTAAEVAKRFGVSRSWVYENATQLSAIRLGSGARARLRFDASHVEQAMQTSPDRPRGTTPAREPWVSDADLIPIRRP